MIAVDTRTWIAFLQGAAGEDVDLLDKALLDRQVLIARLGDALIAQSCVDHGVPFLTRDQNFRASTQAARLDLLLGFTARSADR